MDLKNSKRFPAKILLFGEYLVLKNGSGLALPYNEYSLQRGQNQNPKNKNFFQQLAHYLDNNKLLQSKLNQDIHKDIQNGLCYDSTIPNGYGLGSSGALVAAIYQDYFLYKETELKLLKLELAEIESFFHDKSSGIDPLTSYLNKPVLSKTHSIEILDDISLGNFQLINSQVKRNAKSAIKHYSIIAKNKDFQIAMEKLKEISEIMIQKWLKKEPIEIQMQEYSKLQYKYFIDFIPKPIQNKWQQGLNDNSYYMKLCGAGMGGMYLKYIP